MAPLPPIANTGLLRMYATIGDHTCQMGAHFQWSGTAIVADLNTLCQLWQENWETDWFNSGSDWVSSDCTVLYTTCKDLSSETAAMGQYTHTQVGSATQQCSANDAILLSHAVNRFWRGGHPRTYVFGATTDNIDVGGQTWLSTAQAAALAAWEDAVGAVLTGSYDVISDLAVGAVSYFTGGARRETPVWLPFADTTVSATIRSQRRRVRRTPTPS